MSSRQVSLAELVTTIVEALEHTITADAAALVTQAFAVADALRAAGYTVNARADR